MTVPVDDVAARWRECLLDVLEPWRSLPLLLSGGVDSGTLLAGLLALGERPPCYAFRLGDRDSLDVAVARKMAADWGVLLDIVTIPRDSATLEEDVVDLVRWMGAARKTWVQCAHPVLYLARRLRSAGHEAALVGTGGVVEDNRKAAVLLASEGEEAVRLLRRRNLMATEGNGTAAMVAVAAREGVALHQPYATEPLASYGLGLDVREINWPRQKGVALRAFPEFWSRGYWRRNSPLQVGSGVREWHATLLASPLNTRGLRDVAGVYRDVLAGLVP